MMARPVRLKVKYPTFVVWFKKQIIMLRSLKSIVKHTALMNWLKKQIMMQKYQILKKKKKKITTFDYNKFTGEIIDTKDKIIT